MMEGLIPLRELLQNHYYEINALMTAEERDTFEGDVVADILQLTHNEEEYMKNLKRMDDLCKGDITELEKRHKEELKTLNLESENTLQAAKLEMVNLLCGKRGIV
jgi:mevalonate kinase